MTSRLSPQWLWSTHALVHMLYSYILLVPMKKSMSCHKYTVVTTRRAHRFHDYINIMPIFLLWDLSTLAVVDHLWPLTLGSLLGLLSTLWFTGTSNLYPYIMRPSHKFLQSHCNDNILWCNDYIYICLSWFCETWAL